MFKQYSKCIVGTKLSYTKAQNSHEYKVKFCRSIKWIGNYDTLKEKIGRS